MISNIEEEDANLFRHAQELEHENMQLIKAAFKSSKNDSSFMPPYNNALNTNKKYETTKYC